MKFRNWKLEIKLLGFILNLFRISDFGFRIFKRNEGITLLLVALLLSAILSISVGIFTLVFGQIQISGELADSFHALNAADRAIERVLYLDRVDEELSNGYTEDNTDTSKPLSPQLGCYRAVLNKAPICGGEIETCITVAGQYQCGTNSIRTVKRGFSVTYGSASDLNEVVAVSFENTNKDDNLASFPDPTNAGQGDAAQSFTTTAAINVSKIELKLNRSDPVSDIYLELRASPLGSILGTSETITQSAIPSNPTWIVFRFQTPVSLGAGTTYTIRARSNPDSTVQFSGSMGPANWSYKQQGGQGPYSSGIAYRFVGRQGENTFQELPQYDFGFRVYTLE